MFGSWIRRTGFWALDALKGGTVRKHYNDIVLKLSEDYDGCDTEQLSALLEHAKSTTPFYRRKWIHKSPWIIYGISPL